MSELRRVFRKFLRTFPNHIKRTGYPVLSLIQPQVFIRRLVADLQDFAVLD